MGKDGDLTFIHCADLHLDSQFKGLAVKDDHWAKEMRESTFIALEHMVEAARSKKVDLVVLAGDVFDSDERSVRAQFRFRDAMSRLGEDGIPCYIACGNHDPLEDWKDSVRLPENVHRFSAAGDAVRFRKNGKESAHITGVSYPVRDVHEDLSPYLSPDDRLFSIAVLHCNVGSDDHAPYSPTTKEVLIKRGFDYYALGHVHGRGILNERPHIVYPGNTQGRHVNERGVKGCYHVTVRGGVVSAMEFIPLSPFIWGRCEVDITGHPSLDSLIDSTDLSQAGNILELEFVGRGPLDSELRDHDKAEDFASLICSRSGARLARFRVKTRPELDLESLRQGKDLLASIMRTAGGSEVDDVRDHLKRLPGANRFRKWIDAIDDDELAEIVDEASLLLADRLLEDRG